jgi:hypothetical protein
LLTEGLTVSLLLMAKQAKLPLKARSVSSKPFENTFSDETRSAISTQQQPITLKVNALVDGVHYKAGDTLPFTAVDELPAALKPFVVTGDEPEPNEAVADQANFQLGVTYQLDTEGRRLRALNRQVATLQAQAAEEAWNEEQFSAPCGLTSLKHCKKTTTIESLLR